MYEDFFRLNARPFLTAPDLKYLYWTENHSIAFSMMRYGLISRTPITVMTGEVGAGKTTLIRQLLDELGDDLVVGLVSNMQAGRGELLHWVMLALDQPIDDAAYVTLFQRFQAFVIDCYAQGKRVVIIVDEAQNLSVDMLEELRMLSNMNADGDDLLQLVLVGQPQLRDLLRRPELAQFVQRISSDFHLTALDADEVEAYINHRLQTAGAQWRIFPPQTARRIAEATRGVPRLINVLCDLCLVYGFAADQKVIGEDLLSEFLSGARQRGIYGQFFGGENASLASLDAERVVKRRSPKSVGEL